ncbi:hypothetical protein COV13_02550 [Candidatus Woesearchaeota archaeon CG10_big_fil_rev_8_21_14_0_10_32_9]|nr:MAG: hypothetical protein COV13_02550 [Candidatus Woesearchaeota archaeon CG10_big_fil_rev_8_21_14_0_10_32_9]
MDIGNYVDKYFILVPEEKILSELPKLNHNSANQSYDVLLNLAKVEQITTSSLIQIMKYKEQGKVFVFNVNAAIHAKLELTRMYRLLDYVQ